MLKKLLGNIEESAVEIGSNEMDYVSFGRGKKPLMIIPGLGDGLRTVKGTGIMLWYSYRFLAEDFKVYVFSRKHELATGYTTRDMARDLAGAMDKLGIDSAAVMGFSQGGMIAQWLAIDYPTKVSKLAIVISLARQNETVQKVVGNWIEMARKELYDDLAVDMMEKSHTENYLKKVRPFYWLIKRISKPQSKERFLIQAESCLTHDAYEELSAIKCLTFIIGGGADRIVGGAEVQQEMADAIEGSKLYIYPDLGHGAYAEAKDFGERIYNFFSKSELR
ncbi:MAG: alpha/beta fold hydrolase [Bacillota bacterium]